MGLVCCFPFLCQASAPSGAAFMPNCYPESNPRGGNSARAYFSTPFLVLNTAQTTRVETHSPLRGMRMRAERSMHSRQRNAAEESLQPGIPVRAPRSVLRSPSEKRGRCAQRSRLGQPENFASSDTSICRPFCARLGFRMKITSSIFLMDPFVEIQQYSDQI